MKLLAPHVGRSRRVLRSASAPVSAPPGLSNGAHPIDLKLEVVVLPVSDVDRSKDFYLGLGFRLDVDLVGRDHYRVVHMTPPGSAASIAIRADGSAVHPKSSIQGLHLVVNDIEAARDHLAAHGAEVSMIFHDAGRASHHAGYSREIGAGPHPARANYGSFALFLDPDNNTWVVQEVHEEFSN